jgi:hypothetical protein
MASGETFTWTGDPVSGRNWNTVAGFLILAGGTLINLAQIESMTPVGTVDEDAADGDQSA